MRSRLALVVVLLGAVASIGAGPGFGAPPQTQCAPAARYPAATTPVAFWSTEARCAIVPAGPGGVFGSENWLFSCFRGCLSRGYVTARRSLSTVPAV